MAIITNKFFKSPFAVVGDVAPIPDVIQPSGAVSYPQGYTVDYELNPGTNPGAKNVPRLEFNQVLLDTTRSCQQYQVWGVPNFITTADNLGVPYPYDKNARALYDDGVNGARAYISLVNANTSLPTDQTKWLLDDLNIETFASGKYNAYTSIGTPNALAVTTTAGYQTTPVNSQITIIANATNTAASTLDVNSTGARTIVTQSSTGFNVLSGGEIVAGNCYNFFAISPTQWLILNPNVESNLYGASYHNPANQTVLGNTQSKYIANTARYDTNGLWDNINNRYIVGKVGYFSFNAIITANTSGAQTTLQLFLHKNGSIFAELATNSGNSTTINGTIETYSSSVSDYFELYVGSVGVNTVIQGGAYNVFQMKFLGK